MFSFELSINIWVLALIVVGSVLIGFVLRSKQVANNRAKIDELEREILNNYADILALEKENNGMETRLQDIQSPVIPIKAILKEETPEGDKFPDVSLRKKLLNKENLSKQSVASK